MQFIPDYNLSIAINNYKLEERICEFASFSTIVRGKSYKLMSGEMVSYLAVYMKSRYQDIILNNITYDEVYKTVEILLQNGADVISGYSHGKSVCDRILDNIKLEEENSYKLYELIRK